jgi:hypothetical protein
MTGSKKAFDPDAQYFYRKQLYPSYSYSCSYSVFKLDDEYEYENRPVKTGLSTN